jgi:hypothetical protein
VHGGLLPVTMTTWSPVECQSALAGSGPRRPDTDAVVDLLAASSLPTVIDADALSAFARLGPPPRGSVRGHAARRRAGPAGRLGPLAAHRLSSPTRRALGWCWSPREL